MHGNTPDVRPGRGRVLRRYAGTVLVSLLTVLLAAGPAAADVCQDVTKTRTVTYTVDEPYEIRGDVLVPNYDWVWEKTGTERLYGITGYKTETNTKESTVTVYTVTQHRNTFTRSYTTSYKADGKTWYVDHTEYVDWRDRYAMEGKTKVILGPGGGASVTPFECPGSWQRIKGTETWIDDNEPTCGNHGTTDWGGHTWSFYSHANVYSAGTDTITVTTTTTTKVAQYDWYDSDTYDWVWDIVSYSPENQVIESGTRQVTKERTETYTERECVRPA